MKGKVTNTTNKRLAGSGPTTIARPHVGWKRTVAECVTTTSCNAFRFSQPWRMNYMQQKINHGNVV
jgi:hypothetical protein